MAPHRHCHVPTPSATNRLWDRPCARGSREFVCVGRHRTLDARAAGRFRRFDSGDGLAMSRPDTPVDELKEATNWLTNALDADAGMEIVAFDADESEFVRQEISAVYGPDAVLEDGGSVNLEVINDTPFVVVE
jgi:hypothetical protein